MSEYDFVLKFGISLADVRTKVLSFNELGWRVALAGDENVVIQATVEASSTAGAVQKLEDTWMWETSLPQPTSLLITAKGGDSPFQDAIETQESVTSGKPTRAIPSQGMDA